MKYVIIGIFALLPLKLEAVPPSVLARDSLDGWGINAPCCGGPQSAQLVAQKLNEIGIRRVRAALVRSQTTNLPWWQSIQNQMQGNGYVKPLKFQDLVEAYNNDANTSWDMQKPYILQAAASGLLGCLEGPNEMNNVWTGGGTHGVNNTVDMTNNWAGANGNVYQWADAIHSWVSGLTGVDAVNMAKVKILAPSIATGLKSDFASLPDLTSLVDNGNVHYYASHGMPPNQGNCADNPSVGYFANLYHWCQTNEIPAGSLVVSECGQSTCTVCNTDHSQAAYIINQMHDAAGIGAKGFDIYCMFDPNSGKRGDYESNFGLFKTDGTDKPIATALSALKQLLSLNLNFDDPANLADTASFKPGFDATNLTVSGIAGACSSRVANAVVYPKSDGSTLISVTDEPQLTDGNGQDVAPAPVTASVDFGSIQSWSLYNVLGANPLQPVASGQGRSLPVVLNGYPMYVLLAPLKPGSRHSAGPTDRGGRRKL